jgi:DNA-binding CsgD family transcriptional regulator
MQGAILLDALRQVRANAGVEVYLIAMLVTQIAALAVELPSTEMRDAALGHIDSVPWTDDIADLHFHAARAVAWRHALEGDEFNAFRRLKEALAAASSDAWRVAALTDRAYLATVLGEKRWAAQELRDAHELASTIEWTGVAGEEKLALPVLAELFADRDPSVAISYVTTFSNVGKNYPRILSSRRDRRIEALEAYSLGKVQLALGEREEAKRLLVNAWTIYDRLGILWRAARAALALAQVEDTDAWRDRAVSALSAYPRSWLARNRDGSASLPVAAAASPEAASLTAAQRGVLDLLLEGRGTDDIAKTLGRSTFTVRNHIKAIFKAYGVSSRAALIVKATRGTSQT